MSAWSPPWRAWQERVWGWLPLAKMASAAVGALSLVAVLSVGISARWAQLTQVNQQLAQAHTIIDSLPTHQAALADQQAHYEQLLDRVGLRQSLAQALQHLSRRAEGVNLPLTVVQPQAEEELSRWSVGHELTVREIPLTLELTGRFRQVGAFLEALTDAPLLYSLRKLTMARSDAGASTITAHVALSVYLAQRAVD